MNCDCFRMSGKARSSSESSSSDSEALSIKDDEGNFCVQNRIIRSDKKWDFKTFDTKIKLLLQCWSWSKGESKNTSTTSWRKLEGKKNKQWSNNDFDSFSVPVFQISDHSNAKESWSIRQRIYLTFMISGWLHLYWYNESNKAKETILLI